MILCEKYEINKDGIWTIVAEAHRQLARRTKAPNRMFFIIIIIISKHEITLIFY